jgi:hypothetical protein
LDYLKATARKAEIQTAGGVAVVENLALTNDNFGSPEDYSGGGRKLECLISDGGNMENIAVDVAGSAQRVVLFNQAGTVTLTETEIEDGVIELETTDTVDIKSFYVILENP